MEIKYYGLKQRLTFLAHFLADFWKSWQHWFQSPITISGSLLCTKSKYSNMNSFGTESLFNTFGSVSLESQLAFNRSENKSSYLEAGVAFFSFLLSTVLTMTNCVHTSSAFFTRRCHRCNDIQFFSKVHMTGGHVPGE